MKTKMMTMVKKWTAAILAAVTVATMSTSMATVAYAQDFTGINLETLPSEPTAGMDAEVIKNAYQVGKKLGNDIPSGKVVYVISNGVSWADGSTPVGEDIVVVYKVYNEKGIFGLGESKVMSCKSLTTGKSYDLTMGYMLRVFELNKVSNLNGTGLKVSKAGLQTTWDTVGFPAVDWFFKLVKLH